METLPSHDKQSLRTEAIKIAQSYVDTSKGWPQSDYHLEFVRQEGNINSPIIVIDAVHHDDLQSARKGSGKSVQLSVDMQQKKVAQELAFQ